MSMRYAWGDHLHSPYESLWSIAHKFVHFNLMSSKQVLNLLKKPYQQNCLLNYHSFNWEAIKNLCGISDNDFNRMNHSQYHIETNRYLIVQEGLSLDTYRDGIRYCPDCMSIGFHSMFYQLKRTKKCLAHNISLENSCPECGCKISSSIKNCSFENSYGCICGFKFARLDDIGSRKYALQRKMVSDHIEEYVQYIQRICGEISRGSEVSITSPDPKYHPGKVDLSFNYTGRCDVIRMQLKYFDASRTLPMDELPNASKSALDFLKSQLRYIKRLSRNPFRLERAQMNGYVKGMVLSGIGDKRTPFNGDDLKKFHKFWHRFWFGTDRIYNDRPTCLATWTVLYMLKKREALKKQIMKSIDCHNLNIDRLSSAIMLNRFLHIVLRYSNLIASLLAFSRIQSEEDAFNRAVNNPSDQIHMQPYQFENIVLFHDQYKNTLEISP